jgi:type IX secretion system PorP/SprF family membrane protein
MLFENAFKKRGETMNQKIQSYTFSMILITFLLSIAVQQSSAQESGYFSHHYFIPVLINPGATGFNGDHEILAGYRSNYGDFDGAPRTFTALYNGSFADKIGLGFQLTSDKVGVSNLFEGQLNYAYRFTINDVMLSIGLSTALQTYSISNVQGDINVDQSDILLQEAINGYTLFDGSAGIYGEADKKFFFGVSFPNLIKNRLTDIAGDINLPNFDVFSYAVLVGYRFNIENYNFTVEPSLNVTDLRYSPFMINGNLKFSFLDDQLVGGIGYAFGEHNESQASLLLGTRINALQLFYSYNVSLGDFQQYNNGSHELTLLYRIPAHKTTASTE